MKNVIFFFVSIVAFLTVPSYASWPKHQKLLPASLDAGDWFGVEVEVDGSTAIIGASRDDGQSNIYSDSGAAYIYACNDPNWALQQKLHQSDPADDDYFGCSVDIDGDTVVIGAHGADTGGVAYVFTRSGSTWTEQQKLTASDAASGDNFGHTVAIDGNTIVIGAYTDDYDSNTDAGSAYVFDYNGLTWSQQQKLTPSDAAVGDEFATSVEIDGNSIIVGSPRDDDDGSNSGSAYVFTYNGSTWTQEDKLTASDASMYHYFGEFVDIQDNTALVGANKADANGTSSAGAAYVFGRSGTSWSEDQKLIDNNPNSNEKFGYAIAISGDWITIGAPKDKESGVGTGAAFIYVWDDSQWTLQERLIDANGAPDDNFGWSVDVSYGTVIIGVLDDDDAGTSAGSAHIYDFCPLADLDNDCDVDFNDFAILAGQWFQAPGEPSADIAPSPTRDGIVDWLDLKVLAEQWLQP
ncbi:MAG: FG-GAP repeat protein [Planctomycetota bacterium]